MPAVKIHWALGLNFFHSAIYNCKCAYLSLGTQPYRTWQMRNGHCSAFGNWKMKKWRHFVNTFAHWLVSIRHALHNLQSCRAFVMTFTSEKWKMTIKNSLFRNWQVIPNFFIAHLPILVQHKTSLGSVCLTAQLAIKKQGVALILGSQRMGGQADFYKKPPRLSL